MQRHFRILALLLLALLSSQAIAATNDVAISLYSRWEHLPSERLMKMGEQYCNVAHQPDSALVCFSIVANRYYQGHRSHEDIEWSIGAMALMSAMYAHEFYDYSKAVSCNLIAKEWAEKHQSKKYLTDIYEYDAQIQNLLANTNGQTFSKEALELHQKAFYAARDIKNWNKMVLSFINMMTETIFQDEEALIGKEMDIVQKTEIPDTTLNLQYARCLINVVREWDNKPDSAMLHLKQLLVIADNQKIASLKFLGKNTANLYIALWYANNDQIEKAIALFHENEKLAKEQGDLLALNDAYNFLSNSYHIAHDEANAQRYRLLYLEGKNELLTKRKLGGVNEALFHYELDKKNEQVREMAYREQMKGRVMWGALAFAVVLLVVLALLWLNYRRVQERNRQLYNKSLEMLRADEEKRELIERLQSQSLPAEEVSPYAPSEAPQREGKLGEARQSDILHRVFLVMETCDEIYSPDFSLTRLAELVGDTRNNVSEAINLRYQGNFNALLNEYRIKEACRRFNDRANYGQLTIEGIGQSVGFRSRSAFSTVFKQIVGLTPGAYQRQSN